MKIEAISDSPQLLIDAINKAIEDGDLITWKKVLNDKNEILYSHIPEQWNEKAMPKPQLHQKMVAFKILWWSKNDEPTEEVKGYIVGRFTEVLMVHFRNYFTMLQTYP